MRKVIASIEARAGSTRLRDKIFLDLEGKTVLERVAERLSFSQAIDDIIVATTTNKNDDRTVDICKRNGIKYYRGSENDVLSRVIEAVDSINGNIIVQLGADNPLYCAEIIDEMVNIYKSGHYDYVANDLQPSYPMGVNAHITSLKVLKEVAQITSNPYHRVNVITYVWDNIKKYRIFNLIAPPKFSEPRLRLTLDYKEDYRLIKKIYQNLYPVKKDFNLMNIMEYLNKNPDVKKINSNCIQKISYNKREKKMKLAINGGNPIRKKKFPPYNTIGKEEERAVMKVLKSGHLSDFVAKNNEWFLGGQTVLKFEKYCTRYFGTKYAVSMNSATSCLFAAMGAVDIGPGDEVIVSAYSHCCSATVPLMYNAIPIFTDLEKKYFSFDIKDLESKINSRTKAIIAVDLFGQSADISAIKKAIKGRNIRIISDSAHSAGTYHKKKKSGTLSDIGVYSFNGHKIINTGEGGVAVTDSDYFAEKLRLIRNHAEAVVIDRKQPNLINLLGQNYRMPEIEAAIGLAQMKKLDRLIRKRQVLAEYLTKKLKKIDGITVPPVMKNSTHAYYLFPILYNSDQTGLSRELLLKAVNKEGIPLYSMAGGYVKPLYKLPLFRKKVLYRKGYPFSRYIYKKNIDYNKISCPNVENLHNKELIILSYMYPPLQKKDMDDIVGAFAKVISNKNELV